MSQTVNRCLKDKRFDRIDHALGRPLNPVSETYRNHYAITDTSPELAEFRSSPYWDEGQRSGINKTMLWFYVNDEGRKALAEHLREIGDPHKAFAVTWNGGTAIVVAKSRSEARYSSYLSISDSFSELTFSEFQKTASVRSAIG